MLRLAASLACSNASTSRPPQMSPLQPALLPRQRPRRSLLPDAAPRRRRTTPSRRPGAERRSLNPVRACVFKGPGEVAVEEVPTPQAGPGQILLRTAATGLCYSDVRVFKGEKYARMGVVPGHEISGVIAEVGSGVSDWKAGD